MAPTPETATDDDVAFYIVDLYDAGQDCRRKLGIIRRCLSAATPSAECQAEGGAKGE